jgi:tRNA modification GTPase
MSERDTIISLATIAGESALGIIRISGNLCRQLCEDVFDTTSPTPRKTFLKNYRSFSGKNIDQVLAVFFDHGKSYTGEETLEISFHGNPLIANLILDDLIKRNCRLAVPGEYTKRAYLNGKLDLTQAESVAEIIAANSEIELEIANHQLLGSLSKKLLYVQSSLIHLQAKFEASIDFPEDEIRENDLPEVLGLIKPIKQTISKLIQSSDIKSSLSQGIKVSLIGPPNVGKSSIFNKLLHSNRAIVSIDPGTTRDYLSKEIIISGYKIELFDTAGIRDTDRTVEKLGIQNSLDIIRDTSIVLLVFDSSLPYPNDFFEYIKEEIKSQTIIIIENKCDLKRVITSENYPTHSSVIRSSALDENCSKEIINEISKTLTTTYKIDPSKDILVSKRQQKHLADSMNHLIEVQNLISASIHDEFILQELKMCIQSINSIIGQTDNEDMLDELFKNFCIGK